MRLLVINANTSDIVTEKVAAQARRSASPGTEIVPVTGTFGARVIATRAELAMGEHSTIVLAARHAEGCDAVVVAVSYDTGVRAARELLPVPVVGMTEAALHTACMLGGRMGIILFGRRVLPLYQELVASYGLSSRIAGWRALESTAAYGRGTHDELDREIERTACDLVERDGAEVVVLTGAVMAGVPARVQGAVPVPVVDCIDAAVRQAELLAQLKLPKPTAGSYALPPPRELVDVDHAIAARLGRGA
ncbi:aspartate/glutamate racemase family protein [Hydrogenophaga luteola]|uniref:Aspartate/glutamate racemase family protein n=1 Tax=Hydrogenophaga luteola TaxID=1591122 RepID=A0ABV7W6J8_9BURK